jgi:hypothetical protein
MLLGQILVQKKWISSQQLEETLKQQEAHLLGQFLLKKRTFTGRTTRMRP